METISIKILFRRRAPAGMLSQRMKLDDPQNSEMQASPKKRSLLRKLYDWTISWSDKPQALWALFFIAFAESSFFPIPPDVLLLALCVGDPKKSFKFAAVCAAGSVTGGMAGYAIGFGAWEAVNGWFIPYVFSQGLFDRVQELYHDNAFLAILTSAFTPIPYKVFTVAAGVFRVDFLTLVLASAIGRTARFALLGWFVFQFGPKVKDWVERYFDWVAWGFLALVALGFVALKIVH